MQEIKGELPPDVADCLREIQDDLFALALHSYKEYGRGFVSLDLEQVHVEYRQQPAEDVNEEASRIIRTLVSEYDVLLQYVLTVRTPTDFFVLRTDCAVTAIQHGGPSFLED